MDLSPLSSHKPPFLCGSTPKSHPWDNKSLSQLYLLLGCSTAPQPGEELPQDLEESWCPVLCRDGAQGLL